MLLLLPLFSPMLLLFPVSSLACSPSTPLISPSSSQVCQLLELAQLTTRTHLERILPFLIQILLRSKKLCFHPFLVSKLLKGETHIPKRTKRTTIKNPSILPLNISTQRCLCACERPSGGEAENSFSYWTKLVTIAESIKDPETTNIARMPLDNAHLLHILQRGNLLVTQDTGLLPILHTHTLISS